MRLAFALVLGLGALPATAQTVYWGETGGWTIQVDPVLNNGCYLFSNFDGGTSFGIGFDRRDDTGYVFISDTDWVSLVEGQTYALTVTFGNHAPWEGDSVAILPEGGNVYLNMVVPADFMEEFASQSEVRMYFGDNEIAFLGLQGSRRALNEMVACQDKWDAAPVAADPFAGAATADPFVGAAANPADPFAQ